MTRITQIFFDDALQDTYNNRHLLNDFQGEKFISVPTSFIGQRITWKGHMPFGEYALSKDQLIEMISEGWKIASHGISHINFNDLADSQIRVELYMSKEWIVDYLKVIPEYFVSPFDIVTPYLEEQAAYVYQHLRPYPYGEHQAVFHRLTHMEKERLKQIIRFSKEEDMTLYQDKDPGNARIFQEALRDPSTAHTHLDRTFGGGSTAQEDYNKVLKDVMAQYKDPIVVDIGGGLGRHAQYTIDAAKRLFLVEESALALKNVKSCFPAITRDKITTVPADSSQELAIPTNYVDVVYSFAAMGHMTDYGILYYLKEAHRILKYDGRFIFTYISFGGKGLNQFEGQYYRMKDKCNSTHPSIIRTKATMRVLAELARFTGLEINDVYDSHKNGHNTVIIGRRCE